jgi:hypothetical protein
MNSTGPVPPPPPPYLPYRPRGMAAGGNTALKILIGSAIGLVLGFGTCGMGSVLETSSHALSQALIPAGLFLFVISIFGFAVSAVWFLVAAIVSITRK